MNTVLIVLASLAIGLVGGWFLLKLRQAHVTRERLRTEELATLKLALSGKRDELEQFAGRSELVNAAVREAFIGCGLPADQYGPDFNLVRTGKLTEVYRRAATTLGVDPEFDTVGDVIKWLKD